MNIIYVGKGSDDNIGNGKTASAVGETIEEYAIEPDRTIFSNIKLIDIDYVQFSPDNIEEVLETDRALVILDEIHAITHKNHRISESCTKHGENKGLCYRLSEFFRQVRKRDITTRSTAQNFWDCHIQYRQLMQRQILCEKYYICDNRLCKCNSDKCPDWHEHVIKHTMFRGGVYQVGEPMNFDPTPFYPFYDSYEIVDGWVSYE